MNVATLYSQVALLGFETALEYNSAFYFAANRAIYQVNLLRPHIAETEIFRYTPANLLGTDFATYTRDEDLTFEAEGARAYYFEAAGSGTLYLEKYDGESWKLIGERTLASVDFVPYRGFIKADGEFTDGTVRLRFAAHPDGDFIYFVRNAAMYARLTGPTEAEIPECAPWHTYDISAMCADFLTLEMPPIRRDDLTRLAGGYQIDGNARILLPHEAQGSFKILYRRKPAVIANDGAPEEDMTEIDLDEELCTLLPLLIAAYIWADDEPEKANSYMVLYRERAAEIERRAKVQAPSRMIHKSGW